MTDRNLACPFCGGEVDPAGWLGCVEDPTTGDALVRGPECMSCGATAPDLNSWNRRDRSFMASVLSVILFMEQNPTLSEADLVVLSSLRSALKLASR